MSELSEEQKFSRENFHGLIKIRKNRESFLTMKLLSFTVNKQKGWQSTPAHVLLGIYVLPIIQLAIPIFVYFLKNRYIASKEE